MILKYGDIRSLVAIERWLVAFLALLPVMINNPAAPFVALPILNRVQLADIAFIGLALAAWRSGDLRAGGSFRVPLRWTLACYVIVVLASALASGAAGTAIAEVSIVGYCVAIYVVLVQILRDPARIWLAVDAFALGALVVVVGGMGGVILLALGVENPLAVPSRILPIALSIQDRIPWIPRIESTLRPTANMAAAFLSTVVGLLSAIAFRAPSFARYAALTGALLLLPLTFSRVIIAGLTAIAVGLPQSGIVFRSMRRAAIVGVVALICVMPFISIWYLRNVTVVYSFNAEAKKEIVEPRAGQPRENPVYFFRPGRGLEHLQLTFDFGYNHYFWLKRAAVEMGRSSPWFGIGPGGFRDELSRLQGTVPSIPAGLKGYESAQSQLATTFAELGGIGVVSVVALWVSILIFLLRGAKFDSSEGSIARGALAAIAGLMVASVDLDMMNFRFFWAVLAIGVSAAQWVQMTKV